MLLFTALFLRELRAEWRAHLTRSLSLRPSLRLRLRLRLSLSPQPQPHRV